MLFLLLLVLRHIRRVPQCLSGAEGFHRFQNAHKRYDDPQAVEKDKVEPEVQRVPHLAVDETILGRSEEIQNVSVELAQAQQELKHKLNCSRYLTNVLHLPSSRVWCHPL